MAAVGADAGAHARVKVAQLGQRTGVQVGGEVGRIFVGAVPLAGGGCDYQLIAHKVGGIHPIAVLKLYRQLLNLRLLLRVIQMQQVHIVLLVVHPLIVVTVVEQQVVLRTVAEGGNIHVRRAEQLTLSAGHIEQVEATAALVDHTLAVGPERQLVEHLVVLFLLERLFGLFQLFALQAAQIRAVVVKVADEQKVGVIDLLQTACLHRDGERRFRLAAVDVDAVVDGCFLCALLLFAAAAVAGEQQRLVVQPQKAAFLPACGQLAGNAVLQYPDVGKVAVFL